MASGAAELGVKGQAVAAAASEEAVVTVVEEGS